MADAPTPNPLFRRDLDAAPRDGSPVWLAIPKEGDGPLIWVQGAWRDDGRGQGWVLPADRIAFLHEPVAWREGDGDGLSRDIYRPTAVFRPGCTVQARGDNPESGLADGEASCWREGEVLTIHQRPVLDGELYIVHASDGHQHSVEPEDWQPDFDLVADPAPEAAASAEAA